MQENAPLTARSFAVHTDCSESPNSMSMMKSATDSEHAPAGRSLAELTFLSTVLQYIS